MEWCQINAYFNCNNPAYKYFAWLSNKYLCAWVTRSSLLTAPGSRTINNHQFGNVKSYQPASCTLRPTRAYNKIHMSPSLSNALIFWSDARNTRHPGGNLLQFGIKTSALATLRWGNVAPAHYQSARQIMNVSRCLWGVVWQRHASIRRALVASLRHAGYFSGGERHDALIQI